jgi:mono/diheme cytochrome c family protein
MKKFIQIFKIIGLGFSIILLGMVVLIGARQNRKFDAPYPNIKASKDTSVIARGKYLAMVSHCEECHNKNDHDTLSTKNLAGGKAFNLSVGTIYSSNITAHKTYGIGKYSDAEIARILRFGVKPDGSAVLNFMPFQNLSDADLTAIISYIRTEKSMAVKTQKNEFNTLGKIAKALLVKPVGPSEKIEAIVKPDTTAKYGRYLAMNVANCAGCHTVRNATGDFTGEILAGGTAMESGNIPPNLTPDSTGRLFNYNQQLFIERFRMGKIIPNSEMPWQLFRKMSNQDLIAIYKFLQTVKPVKTKNS